VRREETTSFDLFRNRQDCLIMACIRGADGKEDHCICIYNHWIYDSNFDKALTLSREALDVCCSSVDERTSFAGCAHVVTFPNIYMLK
jgi:hypothetical protein